MSFEQRREAALKLAAATGIWRSHYAPPLYRALWMAGVPLRPPHFASFWFNVAVLGGFFGSFMCLFTAAVVWFSGRSELLPSLLIAPIIGGVVFGLLMAGFFYVRARTYNLPPWSEIQP